MIPKLLRTTVKLLLLFFFLIFLSNCHWNLFVFQWKKIADVDSAYILLEWCKTHRNFWFKTSHEISQKFIISNVHVVCMCQSIVMEWRKFYIKAFDLINFWLYKIHELLARFRNKIMNRNSQLCRDWCNIHRNLSKKFSIGDTVSLLCKRYGKSTRFWSRLTGIYCKTLDTNFLFDSCQHNKKKCFNFFHRLHTCVYVNAPKLYILSHSH